MYKSSVINFLFVISFPIYGIGSYLCGVLTPTAGFLVSISIHLVIIVTYCIDLIHREFLRVRVNSLYLLMLTYMASCILALVVALQKGLPDENPGMTIAKALMIIVPFHAFIVVSLYNDNNGDKLARLTLLSLSIMLAVNLFGYYVLGLSNEFHNIEGRLNLPFIDGLYSGSSLLAIINLLLLYYLHRLRGNFAAFVCLLGFFVLNAYFLYLINSRLGILTFLLVLVLSLFGLIRMRWLFAMSLATLPILLSSSLLIYRIMKLPAFASLLQRVDLEDVTTFNGRSYLWNDGINWLLHDQRGLLFGNGYRGHYFLNILSDVADLWHAKYIHYLHLHSTSLEVLVDQGVVFYFILCIILYRVYIHYKRKNKECGEAGSIFPVVVFILFILQVDMFVYFESLGFVILSLFASNAAITNRGTAAKIGRTNEPGRWTHAEFKPEQVEELVHQCTDGQPVVTRTL